MSKEHLSPRPLDPSHVNIVANQSMLVNMLYCALWAITRKVKSFSVIIYADDEAHADTVLSFGGPKKLTVEQIQARIRTLVQQLDAGQYAEPPKAFDAAKGDKP